MLDWLTAAAGRLSSDPLLQALLAALATFVLEDPTTVACGLLVADGRMTFAAALGGVAGGIALGDVGLYGIGRWGGPRLIARGWVSEERIDRAGSWFRRNLLLTLVVSRFVPGLRLPTFIAAGVLRAPLVRFVVIVVGASVVWTVALLWATIELGERVLPLLGRWRWPAAALVLLAVLLAQRAIARRAASALTLPTGSDDDEGPAVSRFEFWPPWLFYVPVACYALWLGLRHRGLTLPTAANPSIEAGGLIGESKSAILDLVPPAHRRWVAPYATFVRPAGADDDALLALADDALARGGLTLPVVAKPDIGQRGAGVRPVRDRDELLAYARGFPPGGTVMLQRIVPDEPGADVDDANADAAPAIMRGVREAGVLYWRHPGEAEGTLFSITLKLQPSVVGDGRRTLRELILADPRARRIRQVYFERLAAQLSDVPPVGERVPLVFAGNHCQGAVFLDGAATATPALLARIHGIAAAMPEFWFGRFDVRFADPAAFLRGEELAIVEINGAGAEATHIWDGRARLGAAYRTLFTQYRTLYEIGAANRRRGYRPLGSIGLLRRTLAYRRLARGYPATR